MKIAIYVGKDEAANDQRLIRFIDSLSAGGCSVYMSETRADLKPDTDMLVGVGGDGNIFVSKTLDICKNLGAVGYKKHFSVRDFSCSN